MTEADGESPKWPLPFLVVAAVGALALLVAAPRIGGQTAAAFLDAWIGAVAVVYGVLSGVGPSALRYRGNRWVPGVVGVAGVALLVGLVFWARPGGSTPRTAAAPSTSPGPSPVTAGTPTPPLHDTDPVLLRRTGVVLRAGQRLDLDDPSPQAVPDVAWVHGLGTVDRGQLLAFHEPVPCRGETGYLSDVVATPEQLRSRPYVCVLTNENRYSIVHVRLIAPDLGSVTVDVTTWANDE